MKNKRSIKLWAIDDKPREKLMVKGASSLSNSELVAILLGSGNTEQSAVELAKHILDSCDNNLSTLAKKDVKALQKYKGMGPAKSVSLLACFEIAKRYQTDLGAVNNHQITSSKDAYNALYPYLVGLGHEEFWCLFLTRANKIIAAENISKGGIHSSIVDLKILFKKALLNDCCGIILAHNHPSGSHKPSKEDVAVTEKINKACDIVDMNLLDHIIFYNNAYFSFADEGLL